MLVTKFRKGQPTQDKSMLLSLQPTQKNPSIKKLMGNQENRYSNVRNNYSKFVLQISSEMLLSLPHELMMTFFSS